MRVLTVGLLVAGLAVSAGLASCASASEQQARGDRNVLTQEQIEMAQEATAYDLIQTYRPWWLRKRGATSFTKDNPINVYLEGSQYGEVEDLRTILTQDIREIRFYPSAQAQTRFGSGNVSGAIEVFTRR